mmetsp:Transcript_42279/g.92109  ORF Transcript_42279/g.92109 Transcript_42279/m.92109 type:complete len:106 (+) Transcript_42279:1560-1877(+)
MVQELRHRAPCLRCLDCLPMIQEQSVTFLPEIWMRVQFQLQAIEALQFGSEALRHPLKRRHSLLLFRIPSWTVWALRHLMKEREVPSLPSLCNTSLDGRSGLLAL